MLKPCANVLRVRTLPVALVRGIRRRVVKREMKTLFEIPVWYQIRKISHAKLATRPLLSLSVVVVVVVVVGY